MLSRVTWMVRVFVILTLLLVACGGEEEPAPTEAVGGGATTESTPTETVSEDTPDAAAPTEADEAGETPSDEATATEAINSGGATGAIPDDPIGVLEVAEGDPITLAYALVVTGADESLGVDSQRGIELALADRGEVLGHSVELIGEDTGCTPEGGQAAASRIAANDQIVAVVGTSCSSEARVLVPVVTDAGMTVISSSNTAPDLTDPATRSEGYFRTAHNDLIQGAVAAQFAMEELGVTRVATMHDGSLYAEQLANVFAEEVEAMGGEVVAREAVSPTDTDMRPVLTRIAAQMPELVYYPIFTSAGGFTTRQAREVSGLEEAYLMGADGLFSADFIQAAGEGVVGMYLSSPDFSAFAGGYPDFLDKYQTAYGEPPIAAFHAHAYDATMMILDAIEAVAVEGEDGTLYIPRQGLRDAVASTSGYQGLTGNLTCNENGDCADPKIAVYEVISTDVSGWPDSVVEKIYP